MLVPQYLNHDYISYFHHIHFPPKEIFNIIPWRIEILKGLLECKHLVFQTKQDADNFITTCNSFHKYLFTKDCLLENNFEYKVSYHRSEERRVGKECNSGWSPYHMKK